MAKITTLESERINEELTIYLVKLSSRKFKVMIQDEWGSEIYSSHSRLEYAEGSFEKAIRERQHLRA